MPPLLLLKVGVKVDVINIITSVGFPIACCIGMAWYILKRDDKHAKEVENLRKSIDNNTKVMTELLFYLKGGVNNG